jgi:hypothetical protein
MPTSSDPQSKPADPLAADWGARGKATAVLAPLLVALAAYSWCASFEAECNAERGKAGQEQNKETDAEKAARSLAVADKTYFKNAEDEGGKSKQPSRCSKVCYVVHHTLEDVVGLFTALLVYVVYIQVLLGFSQEKWLRRAYKTSAFANTIGLNQARSADRLFVASNRPRIRIKHVWFDSEVWHSQPITLSLAFVNVGVTEAKLREYNIQLEELKAHTKLPQLPTFRTNPKRLDPPHDMVPSGMTFVIKDAVTFTISDNNLSRIWDGTNVWHCYGYVEYEDAAGGINKTAFARVLDIPVRRASTLDVGRWITLRDPDYEYKD